mmetsp:Transcript_18484/g.26836  ORF Transcript_18484/g.26836 Transcript_18484/m.26836 type:complete len:87 (-) Transcript_18484:210-470(-)
MNHLKEVSIYIKKKQRNAQPGQILRLQRNALQKYQLPFDSFNEDWNRLLHVQELQFCSTEHIGGSDDGSTLVASSLCIPLVQTVAW